MRRGSSTRGSARRQRHRRATGRRQINTCEKSVGTVGPAWEPSRSKTGTIAVPGHRRLWRGTLVFAYLRTLIGDDLGDGSRGKIERYGKMTVGTVDEGIGDGVKASCLDSQLGGTNREFVNRLDVVVVEVVPWNHCESLLT